MMFTGIGVLFCCCCCWCWRAWSVLNCTCCCCCCCCWPLLIIPFFSIGVGDIVIGEPLVLLTGLMVALMLLGGELMLFLAIGAGLEVLEWGLMYCDAGLPSSLEGGHWNPLPRPTFTFINQNQGHSTGISSSTYILLWISHRSQRTGLLEIPD